VALKSADLVVEPGEVHALLGANGAGKSTLVKILTGVIRHDGGTIQVNGKDVRIGSPEGARKVGFAPVFQDPALLPDLTVAQNMRLTRTPIAGVRAVGCETGRTYSSSSRESHLQRLRVGAECRLKACSRQEGQSRRGLSSRLAQSKKLRGGHRISRQAYARVVRGSRPRRRRGVVRGEA
jgi:ABC-type sugar transport system ATPase subunit